MENTRGFPKFSLVVLFDVVEKVGENEAKQIRGKRAALTEAFCLCPICRFLRRISNEESRVVVQCQDNFSSVSGNAHVLWFTRTPWVGLSFSYPSPRPRR